MLPATHSSASLITQDAGSFSETAGQLVTLGMPLCYAGYLRVIPIDSRHVTNGVGGRVTQVNAILRRRVAGGPGKWD